MEAVKCFIPGKQRSVDQADSKICYPAAFSRQLVAVDPQQSRGAHTDPFSEVFPVDDVEPFVLLKRGSECLYGPDSVEVVY